MSRIVHLTKRYTGSAGGDAVVVRNLAAHQRAGGHDVAIITSNCDAITPAPGVTKVGLRLRERDIDQINVRRVLSMLGLMLRAPWLLRRTGAEVVHAHTVDMGAAFSLAARARGIPMVLTLHGTSIGSPALSAKKQRLERLLIRAGRYDAILCVSPESVPQLAGLGRRAAAYLPNAVDLTEFPARPYPGGVPPLLFVGRLEPVKGIDVLLQALSLARRSGFERRLRVVGTGSLEGSLRAMAGELGIADRVEFLGALPPSGVARELYTAAALVLPSRYEGFPIAVLEAWASARPVVATSIGALPAVCANGADSLLVPSGDPVALAAALTALCADPQQAERMGQAGRRKVEREYGVAAVGDLVQRVYADVSGRPLTSTAATASS